MRSPGSTNVRSSSMTRSAMVRLTLQWFHEATVVNLTIHGLDRGELLNNFQILHIVYRVAVEDA